jgi:hypothetical protein
MSCVSCPKMCASLSVAANLAMVLDSISVRARTSDSVPKRVNRNLTTKSSSVVSVIDVCGTVPTSRLSVSIFCWKICDHDTVGYAYVCGLHYVSERHTPVIDLPAESSDAA